MKRSEVTEVMTDSMLLEYAVDQKYYCSKCKFFLQDNCIKKRVVRECRKKRLRNV